jgi:hypothetical protein
MTTEYGYGTFASVGSDGFNSIDYASMNKGITPVFMTVPEYNDRLSKEQGRAVYDDAERVHLHIAGDQFSVHSAPVDDYIKGRFPEEYARWKRTGEARHITGTPLKLWPPATPAFVKEMEAINIHSVEDLANIADVHVTTFFDGRLWKERATAWLQAASSSVSNSKFEDENKRLKERLQTLEKLVGDGRTEHETQVKKGRKKLELSDDERLRRSERVKAMWAAKRAKAYGEPSLEVGSSPVEPF